MLVMENQALMDTNPILATAILVLPFFAVIIVFLAVIFNWNIFGDRAVPPKRYDD